MTDTLIRTLFSTRRQIDRRIEKVIDYSARDGDRLKAEIDEYEATDNVERCFRKFLDNYQAAIESGQVAEIGSWVSGFYGSGKSSFTKYLGLALDPAFKVGGEAFIDLLALRLHSESLQAQLRTVARRAPTAVVFLDLGAEQLADNAAAPVSTVLYWKVLQLAGYSKDKKLARLELTLDQQGKLETFRQLYREKYGQDWLAIHDDPLIGNARAAQIVPQVLPRDFPTPESFSKLRFELAHNLRDLAREMMELLRNKTGRENILFLIDEAGQYVASRSELILNLDGLVRAFKELGQGKVWVLATGQQTLAEIVTKATYNSGELNKLRDRFPLGIELDARDIKEITYRRLLTKTPEAEKLLRERFKTSGPSLITYTKLADTVVYKSDPDADGFARYYPFLPQHFELLLELIRALARTTGGLGLRSVIKVTQDVLVDVNRLLPPEAVRLADRPLGALACADDFYDTLRQDIHKTLPHATLAVDRATQIFGAHSPVVRVAKAVAALQPIELIPCTAENLAALLYPRLDAPPNLSEVKQALADLQSHKELGLIEDPKLGGYVFLSDSVVPLRNKRSEANPASGDLNRIRHQILKDRVFSPPPTATLERTKEVRAGVRVGKTLVVGDNEEIEFRLEWVPGAQWELRRLAAQAETLPADWRSAVLWLARADERVDDVLVEIYRSDQITAQIDERNADKDVAQFIRAERKLAERNRDEVERLLTQSLTNGALFFKGRQPRPAAELALTVDAAARAMLAEVAQEVFTYYSLAPVNAKTDLAAKFLGVERLDRMPADLDPLKLVVKKGGAPRVEVNAPALSEVLRAFKAKLAETGGGRLPGSAAQDLFAAAPYGWSKDTTRYLFAALLTAGEVQFHTPEGELKVPGPKAAEACKSTVVFNKVGLSTRNVRPDPDALDRAARHLEELFGEQILPLEDAISRAVRKHLPAGQEQLATLPDRLRLLGLAGEARARALVAALTNVLAGDATDAAAFFGSKTTSLPEDIRWARAVNHAFEQGAEKDVRAAADVRRARAQAEQLFPGAGAQWLPEAEAQTLADMTRSERFFEHLADVRGLLRAAQERAQARYAEARAQLETALTALKQTLEAHPAWNRLSDDDREALMVQLQRTLPLQAVEAPSELLPLLVRLNGLPALEQTLLAEIERRVPPPPPASHEEAENVEVQAVALRDLLPTGVITSQAELEAWLAEVRARLETLVQAQKHIRIE